MGLEGPGEATVADNQWETVLAELQGDGEGFKGLDRLASLDFVSDLLSSEGFEGFKSPGPEERKLTRLASLELLTELFEGEAGLADSGFDVSDELLTPLEEGSGISNNWTDDDLLAALGSSEEEAAQKNIENNESTTGESTGRQENAEENRSPNAGWGPEVRRNNWGRFECVPSENGGQGHEGGAQGASNCNASSNASGQRLDKKENLASARGNASLKAPTSAAMHQAFLPPLQVPSPALTAPSFPPPSKGSAPSEEAPPAGPRMRFTPQQQTALYEFGARVNWVAPGIESVREAHRLCAEIGMGMRQLKKWISNHRPKELRLPVTRPPWSAPEESAPPAMGYGPYPPLSPAALASLAAAQAAVMGQPFSGPFDIPPGPVVNYPPPPGHWPQEHRPFGGEAFNMGGAPQLPYLMDVGYQRDGALRFGGGSGSSVGSMGSQNEGEGGSSSVPEVKAILASEGMKKVLRRKLKDFDPAKVQQLVELCTDYRRKRALLKVGGGLSEGPEPPNKKQRTSALDFYSPGGLLTQPLIPPSFPPSQTPPNLPSESGENSELTECERPADAMDASKAPNPELPRSVSPDLLPNPEPSNAPTQEASAAPPDSCRPGWETGPFGGRSLSTLPSFPSIDLSKWGLEDFTGRVSLDLGGQVNADVTGGVDVDPTQPTGADHRPGTAQRSGSGYGGSSILDNMPSGNEWVGAPLRRSLSPPVEVSDGVRPRSAGGGRSSRGGDGQLQLPGCKFLFEKALTASDTSSLGRIIIPKVHAELHLPRVADKESCAVTVSDADGLMWELKYRFWSNNKSRIYLLEHAADLIQSRGLVPGDSILFYRADDGHLIMLERKDASFSKGGERPAAGSSGRDAFQGISEGAFEGISDSEAFNAGGYTDSQAVDVDRMLMQMYNRA